MTDDPDRVEKMIELRAPRARVWRAISNAKDFATWFGLGQPLELVGDFVPGAEIEGVWIVDGKPYRELFCTIERVEPEHRLVFRWVPYELAPGDDPRRHPTTTIELVLTDTPTGTRLAISESGFAALPADKQYKRRENGQGWEVQAHSIARHVLGAIDVRVEDTLARSPADVHAAIVDPTQMAQYFISRSSGPMTEGANLDWTWDDVGASQHVEVRQVSPSRISFLWRATGEPTVVAIELAPTSDGTSTKLVVTEGPFELAEEAGRRAIRQTQGWTDFCCSLRAYLHHGINLRARAHVA